MESSPRPFLTSLVITPMRVITKPAAAMTAIWPTAFNEATVRAKISTWTILANVANGTVMARYIRVAELKWLQFDSGRIGSISCMWHCPAAYSTLMTSLTRTPACLLAVRKLLLWQTLVPALWRLGLPIPNHFQLCETLSAMVSIYPPGMTCGQSFPCTGMPNSEGYSMPAKAPQRCSQL